MPKADSYEAILKRFKANNIAELEVDKKIFGVSKMKVTKVLDIDSFVQCTDDIVSTLFDPESGEYIPALRNLAWWCGIVSYYTDLKLPDDLNLVLYWVYCEDMRRMLSDVINRAQLDCLCDAVEQTIESRNAMRASVAENQVMKLLARIDSVSDGLDSVVGSIQTDGFMDSVKVLTSTLQHGKDNVAKKTKKRSAKSEANTQKAKEKIISLVPQEDGNA